MRSPTGFTRLGLLAALLLAVAIMAAVPLLPLRAQQERYDSLRAEAEKRFQEGSFALSRDLYLEAGKLQLPEDARRWVDFRLADTLWRSQAATQTNDQSNYEAARKQLDLLVRDIQRVEDRDRVWAEVEESLADSYWLPRESRNWGAAWEHYQKALEWWAGSRDLDLARSRYLAILFRVAEPPLAQGDYYYYGYYGNMIPLDLLQNGLKIARDPRDLAHLHYLVAMTLRRQGGSVNDQQRIPEEFEASLKAGKQSGWYDDALYQYGEFMASSGPIRLLANGEIRQEPDYVKALALFQRLLREFEKGETRYYDQAKAQVEQITNASVGVSVSNLFTPGTEVQYQISWRNAKRVDLSLYAVDLARDTDLSGKDVGAYQWLQHVSIAGKPKTDSWTYTTGDLGIHRPGARNLTLKRKLNPGAYVIVASAGTASARDVLLVTDVAVVLKSSNKQALAYVGSALDGAPVAKATVRLWQRYYDEGNWKWRTASQETNEQGITVFPLVPSQSSTELFAASVSGDRQAFSLGNSYWAFRPPGKEWRIYAYTDRPAYRPNEKAQWKIVARRYDGAVYSTPNREDLEYEIRDPRGAEVRKGKLTLNAFGSAWGDLDLTEAMPLGQYQITFWDAGRHNTIGSATLLRLEEYKLPEFKVSVSTPEVKGRRKTYRLGEEVQVTVQADYYFGGPVANATVEAVVTQSPYYRLWHPTRAYPWYFSDIDNASRMYYGEGQIVKRETLKTDAEGKATLSFPTQQGGQQDLQFRVEARVTDASRREILGSDTVKVTRQRYFVYPRPAHNLYKPGDKVTVNLKAEDANEQPVEVEGTVKVTRDHWWEIWRNPEGREVKGDELRRLKDRLPIFPPRPPKPPRRGWTLIFRGYKHEDILTTKARTKSNGEAQVTFTAAKEGYYRVAWTSRDDSLTGQDKPVRPVPTPLSPIIQAEASVWACSGTTTDLGYRSGGLEIVVDKDTLEAGKDASILVTSLTPNRYVLFTAEADDLYDTRLLHLEGTSELVRLPIAERHVPNVFLNATMFSDYQSYQDNKQVVVPPVDRFLKVDVKADKEEHQPGEEGTLTVSAHDNQGRPVSAEVGLGLVDESLYYIQSDLAGDPRQFFYGTKRQQQVQTQSTLQQKAFWQPPVVTEEVRDKDQVRRDLRSSGRDRYSAYNRQAGFGGGARGSFSPAASASRLGIEAESLMMDSSSVVNGPMGDKLEMARAKSAAAKPEQPGGGAPDEPAVQVRSDFRATVFWQPDVTTDRAGKATVKFTYPDSTTSWKATARVAGQTNQFGIGNATTRTQKPLIVRLQAPRFFVAGDKATVSAVINNNTDKPLSVDVHLKAEVGGKEVELGSADPTALGVALVGVSAPDPEPLSSYLPSARVPAHGEARTDWILALNRAGTIRLTVQGLSRHFPPVGGSAQELTDAMRRDYTIYEHGLDKLVARSGRSRGDGVTVKVPLPKERKQGSTSMVVQVTPSLAVTMLDALPYLIDYPYGCTEQTMSRFLPAAITAKTLKDLGVKPEAVMGRLFGGIEQDYAGKTHPEGAKDLSKLNDMVQQGLARLYDFQHADGGWGWWKEGDTDRFMTAYVVWGLGLAKGAGLDVRGDVLSRGLDYLDKALVDAETDPDLQAWMLHALASNQAAPGSGSSISQFQRTAFDNLWAKRDRLSAYSRALLALSAHAYGDAERAQTLVRNLVNGVKRDTQPDTSVVQEGAQTHEATTMGTAHWGEDSLWWRWCDSGVESTSFVLRALLAIDPKNELVEPVTNWLLQNRRGAQWSNTRDTAIIVLAMNDYLKVSGELKSDLEYELQVNGTHVASKRVTAEEALSAPSRFTIDPALLRDGDNEVVIRRTGAMDHKGPLPAIYYSAEARFTSLEEPVTPVGNQIFARRKYFKLVARPTLLKGVVYDRVPLEDGDHVTSGERVQCVITIEAKNDYEYLMFEDLKPAGLEAVEVRSGESVFARQLKSRAVGEKFGDGQKPGTAVTRPTSQDESDYTGQQRWVYQELRDRKTALFIDKLPEGVWELRYDLRAETPGQFHALPVVGQAMYVPEIRCNGAEVRLTVDDAPVGR